MPDSATADFTLPPALTMDNVEALWGELKARLDRGAAGLTLDASQVEVINTHGVQLMLALHKSLADTNATLRVHAPSAAFRQAVATLGFDEYLKAWAA